MQLLSNRTALSAYYSIAHRNSYWLVLLISATIFFWLAPLTGDDLTFLGFRNSIDSAQGFIAANQYMYQSLNGRVLGNGIQLLMIDTPLLSALFRGAVLTGIIFLVARLFAKNNFERNLFTLIILFLPIAIFAQTYAWRAGFNNYVTPLLVLLAIYHLVSELAASKAERSGALLKSIYLFLLGIASALFAENITIATLAIVIIAGGILIVRNPLRRKALSIPISSLVGGIIIGTIIMFSSPVYSSLVDKSDGYREVGSSGLNDQVGQLVDLSEELLINYIGQVALASLAVVLLFHARRITVNGVKEKLVIGTTLGFTAYVMMYAVFSNLTGLSESLSVIVMLFHLVFFAIYILSIAYAIYAYWRPAETGLKNAVYVFLAASILNAAPFVYVSPFGPRTFYISYVLSVCALVVIIVSLYQIRSTSEQFFAQLTLWSLIIFAVMTLTLFSVLHYRHIQNQNIINDYKNSASDDGKVYLRKYPFSDILHDSRNSIKAKRGYFGADCRYSRCEVFSTDAEVVFVE